MVQTLCLRQHTCGVGFKILFKTWQGEDEVEFGPLRMRKRFATCGCVLRISLWLKLHSQIEMATATLWEDYDSKVLWLWKYAGSRLVVIDHYLNDPLKPKKLVGTRCGHKGEFADQLPFSPNGTTWIETHAFT
jgi:hypothetical protein